MKTAQALARIDVALSLGLLAVERVRIVTVHNTRVMFNIQLTASKQVFFNDFHLLLSICSNVQHLTVSK